MWRKRFIALVLLFAGAGIGYSVYAGQYHPEGIFGKIPFKYGLDIQGGTQLVYQAERELAQQRALIQLFIGDEGVSAFDEVNSQIPKIKEALGSIQTKDRKVCSVRPEEATNWCEYCEALSKLRCVMQEYARV